MPAPIRALVAGLALAGATLLTSQPASADPAERRLEALRASSGWVCNAYARGKGWVTVTGSRRPTRQAAQDNVMSDCRGRYFACRTSGCWAD